ncbi:DUF6527 family protein [Candidatus Poriferisocius sp.]|uniref:DUF6527 family protein n=1 Tax=Candidatus Poriferisocius sp. TaxID=3101276 RepID=UPI003B02E155
MTGKRFAHAFVETIPTDLEDDVLYVSIEFRTTMHRCACGCGNSVVLPLRPSAWALTYNGDSISMSPSIGNWTFECKSHYWIRESRIIWAKAWSGRQIEAGRRQTLVDRGAIGADDRKPGEAGSPWRRFLKWVTRARAAR